MKVLVIDIGGTNVKFLASEHKAARRFPSGSNLTPRRMVANVKQLAADGKYEALIADNFIVPLELAHVSYNLGTYEDYVAFRGLKRVGMKKWRKHVADVAQRFVSALNPDDVVFGGGGARHLRKLPKGCRLGDNAHALLGGVRLWENAKRKKKKGT